MSNNILPAVLNYIWISGNLTGLKALLPSNLTVRIQSFSWSFLLESYMYAYQVILPD
ncbi:hypothetical protein [Epilithonimonas lactis]|uniref:hypothetical protein n=1 Tax=Epilithonimonas lactis TaxID=421072 RepID=UPI00158772C7|nr:hypothetical protein [Epilithonimonas lactis]